jgi:enterochelin esterase-like enzyme
MGRDRSQCVDATRALFEITETPPVPHDDAGLATVRSQSQTARRASPSVRKHRLLLACGVLAFLVGGTIGVGRYLDMFWLYRGFAAPSHPKFVTFGEGSNRRSVFVPSGTLESYFIRSAALGDQGLRTYVYLPPGYWSEPGARYPVLYLLHGFPGGPSQFAAVGDVAVISDVLLAESRIRPMILVMPSGSTSFFVDNAWANGLRPRSAWESFVVDDVVRSVDARFRTVRRGSDRGIGGLSEGGYGALNIAFHHLGEFDLIEGWSAYFMADRHPPLFGRSVPLFEYNSPAVEVTKVATGLRANHAYIWLYSGSKDPTRFRSRQFSAQLSALGVAHKYSEPGGRHNWKLWRSMMVPALTVASEHFQPVAHAA